MPHCHAPSNFQTISQFTAAFYGSFPHYLYKLTIQNCHSFHSFSQSQFFPFIVAFILIGLPHLGVAEAHYIAPYQPSLSSYVWSSPVCEPYVWISPFFGMVVSQSDAQCWSKFISSLEWISAYSHRLLVQKFSRYLGFLGSSVCESCGLIYEQCESSGHCVNKIPNAAKFLEHSQAFFGSFWDHILNCSMVSQWPGRCHSLSKGCKVHVTLVPKLPRPSYWDFPRPSYTCMRLW